VRKRFLDSAAILIALAVIFPIYWMVLVAIKPAGEIQSLHQRPWTVRPSLAAFRRVLTVDDFGRYFLNSVVVALVVVVVSGLLAFLAAVAVSRFRFRFRTTMLILFLVAQMVPVEALTIPLFFLVRDLGATVPGIGLNTLGSLMVVHTGFTLPFAIWMLRGFVAAVPEELDEAAQLDGASRFARTFIISATGNQTLPMALLVFFKPDENDWGGIMAASTLMTIPVLIFFLLVRRRLVAGLGGAVKD
jgi:N,N'-diacetylchitobiose transport system permease protein